MGLTQQNIESTNLDVFLKELSDFDVFLKEYDAGRESTFWWVYRGTCNAYGKPVISSLLTNVSFTNEAEHSKLLADLMGVLVDFEYYKQGYHNVNIENIAIEESIELNNQVMDNIATNMLCFMKSFLDFLDAHRVFYIYDNKLFNEGVKDSW